MKTCESCGSKNATRAQFCSTCGTKFRIVDAVGTPKDGESGKPKKTRANLAKESDRIVVDVVSESENDDRRRERINSAAARVGSGVLAGLVVVGRFLGRLLAPIFQWILAALRDSIVRALSPSSSWDPCKPPNFIYWAVLDFIVFQLPFAVVGIVYSVLANTARKEGDYDSAQLRAEAAKNWLIIDFCVGLVLLVFRKLVL